MLETRSRRHDKGALRSVLGVDAPVEVVIPEEDESPISQALERQYEAIVFGKRFRSSRRWRKPGRLERAYARLADQRPPSASRVAKFREIRWEKHFYHPLLTMVGRTAP